jgi:hypothetical protein
MIKCIGFLWLSVLVLVNSAAAAESTGSPQQLVQQHSKADNLLLDEIPQVVTEWTLRCTQQEAAQDPNTHVCWTDAASTLTRYTKGLNASLIKQVEQLQADWLSRAAQLQASAQNAAAGEFMSGPRETATEVRKELPRKVLPEADRRDAARTQITHSTTQSRSALVAKLSQTKKPARIIKLVQSKKHQKQALRVIKKGKTKIEPAAVQRPLESSRYPSTVTVSEKQEIRDQLRKIAQKVDCSTLTCMLSKKHKQ